MDENMDLSILLPVKNGEKYLPPVLQAIQNQKTGLTFETIAVDSGSTDRTLGILKDFNVRFFQIEPADFNHGLTRNKLAGHANGKYLLFLNQDVILLAENFLDALMTSPPQNEIAAVFPRQIALPDCRNILWLKDLQDAFKKEQREIAGPVHTLEDFLAKYPLLSTACALLRADLLKEYPFKEVVSGEDQEWAARILNQGYRVIYDPSIEVLHSHDGSFHSIYRYYFGIGKASLIFGFKKTGLIRAILRSLRDHYAFIRQSGFSGTERICFTLLLPFQVIVSEVARYRAMQE